MADHTELTRCLSQAEQVRADRFRLPLHAHRHRVGRAMARHLLANWRGRSCTKAADEQTWVEGQHGKPALGHAGAPRFNLSHSGDWAMLAVSDTLEVGVDLEGLASLGHVADMASRILSPDELAAHAFAPSPQALLSSWVRKEACLKALGTGLSQEMNTFSLDTGVCHGRAAVAGQPAQVGWGDLDLPDDCPARACCAWLFPEFPAS